MRKGTGSTCKLLIYFSILFPHRDANWDRTIVYKQMTEPIEIADVA